MIEVVTADVIVGLVRKSRSMRVKAKVRAEMYATVWSQPQLSLKKTSA